MSEEIDENSDDKQDRKENQSEENSVASNEMSKGKEKYIEESESCKDTDEEDDKGIYNLSVKLIVNADKIHTSVTNKPLAKQANALINTTLYSLV